MRPISRFFRLTLRDQRLLIQCAALLGAIRLGLWLVPFDAFRRFLGRLNRAPLGTNEADDALVSRIVWAVSVIGRRMPRAGNCLAQALTTQLMLGRRGRAATLRIGVALSEAGEFRAHAWLEADDGKIVIGGSPTLSSFVPLPPLKGEVR